MSNHRHYNRAPIKEALIDMQCSLPSSVDLEDLLQLEGPIATDYPTRKERFETTSEIKLGKDLSTKTTNKKVGYVFEGTEPYVFQARLNGFTLSRLAPYEEWESLVTESRRLWSMYLSIAAPEKVTRLGIRYINVLEFESDRVRLPDYLRTRPNVSSGIRGDMGNFFMRVELPQKRLRGMGIVTVSTTPGAEMGLILDIDVFKSVNIAPDDDRMWVEVEKLHDREYRLFEACITDRTREMIS